VRGRVALDDAYAAGRVVDELAAYLPEWAIGDSPAEAMPIALSINPLSFIRFSPTEPAMIDWDPLRPATARKNRG
jgi:hypothetical protein